MSSEAMIRDPLTGTHSRTSLPVRLQEEIGRALRYGEPFSLLIVDLDHFKSVNDAFGHIRGDQVLVEFADRLYEIIRDSDLLFRYGGDEFVLILPNTTKEQALALAQRLLQGVSSLPFRGDPPLSLSISMGVASLPEDAQSAEALFEKADLRLYEAKRRGRNQALGKDLTPPSSLLPEPSRLVEREEAMAVLHRLLEMLPERKRAVLAVTGPPGSGRSYFLAEAGKAARLWGYEVIALRGTPALQNRPYGALVEPWGGYEGLPPPTAEVAEQGPALLRLLSERGKAGLFFTVDDLPELDWATLELLRHLFFFSPIPLFAIAYSVDRPSSRRMFPLEAPLRETVELQAFSQEGLRIWLRSLLQWEPPEDFLRWLYRETGGLPALLQQGISYLVGRGILEKEEGGWRFSQDFTTVPLGEKLEIRAQPPPHNLPVALTSFVGREREIQQVKALLEETRLLTILGPGGVGKTRLALQLAAERIEDFPDGVYFIPLTHLGSADFLISTIAEVLDFSFSGPADARVQLFGYLHDKKMLLVMDNLEHIPEGAGLLAEILRNAPRLRILATSREQLNVQAETIFELQGMDCPEDETTTGAEGYSAVQLFLQGARRADPHFSLSAAETPFVVRICQLVEGIPLGIELAAAWVRAIPCREIAQEIGRNLDFLTTSLRDMPERHRSLRATFEYSWSLLSEEERKVFRKLSVFRGGFRREAADQVAGASLPLLLPLVAKSFLHRNAAGRYEIHEVLKQYAEEKLQDIPREKERARDLHCSYYAEFLHQREDHLKGQRQKEALGAIGEEIENVRAAWQWAVERGRIGEIVKSLDGLWLFYEKRSWFQEGEAMFKRAVERLGGTGETTDRQGNEESRVLGRVLVRQGWFCHRLSLYRKAKELLQESLGIFRRLGDREETAVALNSLCAVVYDLGEYALARRLLQESLAIRRELGDRRGVAGTLNNLGLVAEAQGAYGEARRLYQESLGIVRELGDPWVVARALTNLGNVACCLGGYAEAGQLFQESLAICQEIGDRLGIAFSLARLGNVARMQGEYTEAKRLFQESLKICREIGDQRGIAISLNNLGDAADAQKNYQEAKKYYCEALQMAIKVQALPVALDTLVGMAAVLARGRRKDRAVELLAFVLHHPASNKETKDRAGRLLAEQEGRLPPRVMTMAQERAREALAEPGDDFLQQAFQQIPAWLALPEEPLRAEETPPSLRILALGTGQVFRGEEEVQLKDWKGHLPCELFFYLLFCNPVRKEQIGLALWPGIDHSRLTSVFHTTLHRARRAVGTPFVLFHDSTEVYHWNPQVPCWCDVWEFERLLDQAERLPLTSPPASALLEQAISLYRGDFLEGFDSDWCALRREELHERYLGALLRLGRAYLGQRAFPQAQEVYQKALQVDSLREEAYRGLMRCHVLAGELTLAIRAYRQCRRHLAQELHVDPSPETQELYRAISRGERLPEGS